MCGECDRVRPNRLARASTVLRREVRAPLRWLSQQVTRVHAHLREAVHAIAESGANEALLSLRGR